MSTSDEALMQATMELVAEMLADARKAWAKEMETISAESRAVIAECRTAIAELKAATLAQRNAELESQRKAKRS